MLPLPLHHVLAFRRFLTCFLAQCELVLVPDIFIMKQFSETRPTGLVLVPSACNILIDNFAPFLRKARRMPALRRDRFRAHVEGAASGAASDSPEYAHPSDLRTNGGARRIPHGRTERSLRPFGSFESRPGNRSGRPQWPPGQPRRNRGNPDLGRGPISRAIGEIRARLKMH